MSVRPTVWVTDPFGLGRGRSSFGADWANAALLAASVTERMAWGRERSTSASLEKGGARSIGQPRGPGATDLSS